jgi:hypothetical protein
MSHHKYIGADVEKSGGTLVIDTPVPGTLGIFQQLSGTISWQSWTKATILI